MLVLALLVGCDNTPVGADSSDSPCEQQCYAIHDLCPSLGWAQAIGDTAADPYDGCIAACGGDGDAWAQCYADRGWPGSGHPDACDDFWSQCEPAP